MISRGFKSKFGITLLLLLMAAMVLVDFTLSMLYQKITVDAEVARGQAGLLALKAIWRRSAPYPAESFQRFQSDASLICREGNYSCMVVNGQQGIRIGFDQLDAPCSVELERLAQQSQSTGRSTVSYFDQTWGLFWKQARFLLVAAPLESNGGIAAAALALPLDSLWQKLRHGQRLMILYMILNAAIFALIGIRRFARITLAPLNRLARKAENYDKESGSYFVVRKEDNELNRLSAALNSMLTRLTEDRRKLQITIQELGQANRELRQAQDEVLRAEKLASVGRLSAGIAHEIGNPVGIVLGYLGLLKQNSATDEEKMAYIERAEEEIQRINLIIRQMLDLSRPSLGDAGVVSLHRLMQDIAILVQHQPLTSEIDLRLDLAAAEDTVWADANQLRQVFLNLVINAADAIAASPPPEGGKLVIASQTLPAEETGKAARIQVRFEDNGSGIPAENVANIFDPFFTTKAPGMGTGLGLSVSFMIIEKLGGTLTARNGEQGGTVMIIELPLQAQHPESGLQEVDQR